MASLGRLAVLVGLIAAVAGVVTQLVGLRRKRPDLLRLAGQWALVTLFASAVAALVMEWAILTDNFSFEYVARNSTTTTPLLYKVATLWGALEGSILLWVLILAGYIVAVGWRFRSRLDDPLVAWAMLTLFVIAGFFFLLLTGPADPFNTLAAAPADGRGLNPLLQNHPLMAVHPVMLYLGYVGFSVPFSFAIAALVTGRLGEGWLLETRTWTVLAWGFLTTGIVLGAWWSYEVLGWGGYWAWDPVENSSLLPWLTSTAYLHSVVVQERRGMLRIWNLSLLLSTFALTILGTFLTRSGVLRSVHEFSQSNIGIYLLTFFGLVVIVSLALIAWRGEQLTSPGSVGSPVSREGSFLVNNLLFAAFALVVLLGTVFPLLIEAINGDRLAVGSPYFDRMTGPIGLALLFLMGMSPLLSWRRTSGESLREKTLGPAWVGAIFLMVAVAVGARGWMSLVAFALAGFVVGSAGRTLLLGVRRRGIAGFTGRNGGGMVAHIGIALLAVGFVASQSYSNESEVRLNNGQTVEVAGHSIEFLGRTDTSQPGREITSVRIRVDGNEIHEPAITQFATFGTPIATPSVDVSLIDDVYLSVLDVESEDGSVLMRVIVRPMIAWLWIGGLTISLGSILAVIPVRGRVVAVSDSSNEPPADGSPDDDEPLEPETEPATV
ncbi:MAG TPA: heme lyase CcmF/NrfE family subunit [Acidimicrobiales bacterium]|nr:heme lyase CcmF/NrfE family subunit [Acidimicrobiales bacterium]